MVYGITDLTTNDFLYNAIQRRILTVRDASDFMTKIREMGISANETQSSTNFTRRFQEKVR